MSVVLVPPKHGKPDNLSEGQAWFEANESEWTASQLKAGDRCWFRRKRTPGGELGPWTEAEFRMSYLYDGVHARVRIADPDDLIELSLFLGAGDLLSGSYPQVDATERNT